ncbi:MULTISPECIES: type II/IV secretion system ATPase subunit [Halobacterium]|uniref:type II/IV secretion system ATPase subunit n=1 Tax=Halobacterium TaxID=2239 RepID=UPI00073EDEC7|nr:MULTISPECIES: type II/IV secretion system ATPase subunit [Halobacterium]MCG1002192.1 type II/IV secretion system ATPase subunit [Halobacterium noricense]
MRALLERFRADGPDCCCDATRDGSALRVDAGGCPGSGDLLAEPACRATVTAACRQTDVDRVVVDASGFRREYGPRAVALFTAAGRFAARVADRDQRLAARARTDPLAAAAEASGRAGPVADIAAETGFAAAAGDLPDYDALRPRVGPALADARIEPTPPPAGRLRDSRALETDATVREYAVPDGLSVYHVVPPEYEFAPADCRVLADARRLLADGSIPDGEDAPGRAVREAAGEHREPLADALRKHTRGFGVLEDLFADPRISDVYASAPVAEGSLRVTVDGEDARTNVRFTDAGAERLASRLRAESGRPFSRANPTLDTALDDLGTAGRVRVAGVTDPVSDGTGFAFRAHDADPFRLPDLVANGTLSPRLAGFLVEALRRGASVLFAGARGAGKTTLLGATLWGLAAGTRLVTIEDTPELPVRALRSDGRDVQALYADADGAGADVSMADALRTALRLGDGAIAVGEVRGEEARVLYEAMRVGASDAAVLGTIHGEGAAGVRERVVSDLGIAASSFAATDLVVTLADTAGGRRVTRVEEVTDDGAAALYADEGDGAEPTGRIARGNSSVVADLAAPGETYADVRDAVRARADHTTDA